MWDTIHYLSATAVNTPEGVRHLAFCGEQFDYYADKPRFQVANYSDPTRVTCQGCLVAYATTYPDRWKLFRLSFPRPIEWTPPQGEHPDVSLIREGHAHHQRAWLRMWVNDPTVSDLDLMAMLTHRSYDDAKELARIALRLNGD
jgi:hypothetical protein